MKGLFCGLLVLGGVTTAAPALADTLYGSCRNKAGDKCRAIHRISTSWNSRTASFPARGKYRLNFGGTVNSRITVYCDGRRVGTVHVRGSTRFDVVCR